jgi:drug/metabolite transporter (DMT)-like permease
VIACAPPVRAATRSPEVIGVPLAVAAAGCYALSNIVGRTLAAQAVDSATALAGRFAVAGGILAVLLWLRRAPLRPAPGEWVRIVALGAFGYTSQSTLFYLSLARGTAAACVLIYFSYPAIVTAIELARGRPVPPLNLAAMALSVCGTAVVVASGHQVAISGAGIALALAAAATYAGYLCLGREAARRSDPMTAACWIAVGAAAASLCRGVLGGTLTGPMPYAGWLLLYGAATAGAFGLTFAALRRLPAQHVAVVATTEAIGTVALAGAVLGETVTPTQLLGGVVVAAAAATTAWSTPGRPARAAVAWSTPEVGLSRRPSTPPSR